MANNRAAIKRAVLAQVKKLKLTGKGGEVLVIRSDDNGLAEAIVKIKAAIARNIPEPKNLVILGVSGDTDVFKITVGK